MIKEGQRLRMIKLGNYNTAKELSIENRKTESLGLIRHRDTGPDGKRTKAAVHIEGKRVTTRMRNRAAYTEPPIGNDIGPEHDGPAERKGHQQKEEC